MYIKGAYSDKLFKSLQPLCIFKGKSCKILYISVRIPIPSTNAFIKAFLMLLISTILSHRVSC